MSSRLFDIEARMLRAEHGYARDEFDAQAIDDMRFLLTLVNEMFTRLSPDDQAVYRAEALEDLQHALIVGDEKGRQAAERRLTPPRGNESVEEAIADEICAMAHKRNTTYAGGHCEDCMVIAKFAVRTVLEGLR